MFCNDFLNAIDNGAITLGNMTDWDDDGIYLDFTMRVNGTSARINYCPFCSRIVRGRRNLSAIQGVEIKVLCDCGNKMYWLPQLRKYHCTQCQAGEGTSSELPDEMFDKPF